MARQLQVIDETIQCQVAWLFCGASPPTRICYRTGPGVNPDFAAPGGRTFKLFREKRYRPESLIMRGPARARRSRMPCQALQTGIRGWHESGRRGQPCSGPVRSGIRELVRPDSGRPGRRTCGGTRKDLPPERRRPVQARLRNARSCVGAGAGSGGSRLPRQQQGHCRGGRSRRGLTGHPRHDVGIFPPLQPGRRESRRGTPSRCRQTPRWRGTAPASPDAPARCRGGGTSRRSSVAERAADRRGLGLRRARRQVRPVVPPGWQPGSGAAARQACARA